MTARLRDARFFWDADRQVGARGAAASGSRRCCSTRARVRTGRRPSAWSGWRAGSPTDVLRRRPSGAAARRAARLAKADLATDMVREFTELQGMMGGIYAREEGRAGGGLEGDLPPLPAGRRRGRRRRRRARSSAPRRVTWAACSLADKLDTLVGLFRRASGRPGRAIRSRCGVRPMVSCGFSATPSRSQAFPCGCQ